MLGGVVWRLSRGKNMHIRLFSCRLHLWWVLKVTQDWKFLKIWSWFLKLVCKYYSCYCRFGSSHVWLTRWKMLKLHTVLHTVF